MSLGHIIKYINMLMREIVSYHGLGLIIGLSMKRSKDNQKENTINMENNEYPKIPCGFSCYVCGSTFETNQERLMHLENFRHKDLYSTVSPQESEEVHRLSL
jgi:hypothetical protein